MRILVTGATGAVGPRVVSALRDAGHSVLVLAMDAPTTGLLPNDVEIRIGDITDSTIVAESMSDIDIVVHLAALLHIVNPPPELRKKYERINVGGTATVVDAAVKAGVKRVILASTIAVYGPSDGKMLNEDSVPYPDTFYAQTKLAAEKIVLIASRADGQPLGTVLRFGAVYGSSIKGNYQRLVGALARGRFLAVGDGSNRRSLIYDKDLARAIVLVLSREASLGHIFNVTDCQFHTMKEIVAAMSLALGRIPPRYSLPVRPVRWAARLVEEAARLMGCQSPIVRATIDKYTEDIAVSGDKICRLLGFRPQYDLASGWRETVEDMRRTGEL
jgi:UDP-glucose 4-epimerase